MMRAIQLSFLVLAATAMLEGCGPTQTECRCAAGFDNTIKIGLPRGWRGTREDIKGTGPGCSVRDGQPQTANIQFELIALGPGNCHVEIDDETGAVIFTQDLWIVAYGGESCCGGYIGGSVDVPEPDAGDQTISIPPRDAGAIDDNDGADSRSDRDTGDDNDGGDGG
jgi:hypothetical protein